MVTHESVNVVSDGGGAMKVGACETSASAGGFPELEGLIADSLREAGSTLQAINFGGLVICVGPWGRYSGGDLLESVGREVLPDYSFEMCLIYFQVVA
jgi:hypothetical protein